MKTIITALLSLTIVSCGMNRGNQNKDPELTNVIMQAANDLESRGFNTSKIWTNVDSWEFSNDTFNGEFGRCKHGDTDLEFNLAQTDQGNHITINRQGWLSLNDWERKELMIHELGHCAYGMKHSQLGLMRDGITYIYSQNSYDNLLDNFVYGVKK
jgi:hypothetical protein